MTKQEILSLIQEGVEGGALAARLGTGLRMQLIERGYNPMSPTDVTSFLSNQKPQDGLGDVAGVNQFKSLGSGRESDRDYQQIETGFVERPDGAPVVQEKFQRPVLQDTYQPKDLSSVLEQKLALGDYGPQRRTTTTPVGGLKQSKMLTEQRDPGKLGYQKGMGYIQAFIENIKNPSIKNRLAFIESVNKMIEMEDGLDREQLQKFYAGVSVAEKKLYEQIKK